MHQILPKQPSRAAIDYLQTGLERISRRLAFWVQFQGRARQGASATTNGIYLSEEELL
jgi:hypothetical protein